MGTVASYLDEAEEAITSRVPDADARWIGERREHKHHALPYAIEPYDFLAINTPSSYEQGAIPTHEEPPIGMIRVVASAGEAGYTSGILDAHALNMSIDQIAQQLERILPRLVGINPTSVNVPEAKALANLCDEVGIPYIVGGVHATLDPVMARRDFPNAEAIVRGDGEIAIRTILANLTGQAAGDSIAGVYTKGDSRENESLLPYAPKMPTEQMPWYPQDRFVQFPVMVQTITVNGEKHTVNEGSVYSTRGCPFACSFCASPVMVGRGTKGVRPYDHPGMDRIIGEIKDMLRIGANAIHSLDDMVMVQPGDVNKFYDEVQKEGLLGKFVWRGMTRASVVARDSFDAGALDKLRESGCWRLTMGVESGDDDILQMIKKKITTAQAETAVQKLVGAGVQVKAFFIMGFPGETREQMQKTYKFVMHLKDLGLASISIFQFKPYPGTALWDKIARENPGALQRLDYIGGDARDMNIGGGRAIQGVYLPDDLVLSDGVPSGEVKQLVQQTLEDFFS